MDQAGSCQPVQRPACPRLNDAEPSLGGVIKGSCEDFLVDEIPLYEPSGEGEHLILHVQKRDVSSLELRKRVARKLALDPGTIGIAGMKDRRAVTRQFISVPRDCETLLQGFADEAIQILSVVPHGNKIKTGHLAGNRFRITVRETDPIDRPVFERIADRLRQSGCPNYYGEQRFGNHGESLQIGLDLLSGKVPFNRVRRRRGPQFARLALSAVQSLVFNQVLHDRVVNNRLTQLFVGDVVQRPGRFSTRLVRDFEAERDWLTSGEWVVSGPIPGPRMRQPEGMPALWETGAMQRHGVQPEKFREFRRLTPGSRRPLVVRPSDLICEQHIEERTATFGFTLPPGSYATVLLREFMGSGIEPESGRAEHG